MDQFVFWSVFSATRYPLNTYSVRIATRAVLTAVKDLTFQEEPTLADTVMAIAYAGDLELLKNVKRRFDGPDQRQEQPLFPHDAAATAASSVSRMGHLDVVKRFKDSSGEAFWRHWLLLAAALKTGQLSTTKWLYDGRIWNGRIGPPFRPCVKGKSARSQAVASPVSEQNST